MCRERVAPKKARGRNRSPVSSALVRSSRPRSSLSRLPLKSSPHLAHGPVRLQEVGLEVGVEQATRDALDRVVDRQHVHALAVLDVGALFCFSWLIRGGF